MGGERDVRGRRARPRARVADGVEEDDPRARGGADPSLSTIRHLGSGRVVVRSAHDPLMAALNVTEGSMFFAEKQAGQAAAATVLLVVGVAHPSRASC